jgi:broad specificity phosphatase PhoE
MALERLVLVRHAETPFTATGTFTPRDQDPQLTNRGKEQAEALARPLSRFGIERTLASPALRARETCELAGYGATMEVDERLLEWDYGDYGGLTFAEIRERNPGWRLWRDGAPGGERPEEVEQRVDDLLGELREGTAGTVCLFAHGHLLRVLGARWIDLPARGGSRLALAVASICVLDFERQTEVIRLWNWNEG